MNERLDITRYTPFENIYLEYQVDEDCQDLFYKNPNTGYIFTDMLRLKIFTRLLSEPREQHGLDMKLGLLTQLPEDKSLPTLLAAFPMHNRVELECLLNVMFSWEYFWPWVMPHHDIKEYYGEKISLYYRLVYMYI